MLALLCFAAVLQGRVVDGATGGGVPSVAVSNGRDVVLTGADGAYALPESGRFVFVIKPSGWRVAGSFYRRVSPGAAGTPAPFRLARQAEAGAYDALVLTDPQPANLREVGYLDRSLAEPLAAAGAGRHYAFGLILGDLTYDRPDLYPQIVQSLSRVGLPWYPVNGNHDLVLGVAGEGAVDAYEAAFGPSTYAFHWGPALFIAVNDVRHHGGPLYRGGILPDQWRFLGALLAGTPRATPVVLYCHIPLFNEPFAAPVFPEADRARLLRLLQPFTTALILSGHTHTLRHVFYGPAEGWKGGSALEEYTAAAACGGYWGGSPDAAGVPVSTMSDGAPAGYAILHVAPNALRAEYRRRPDLGPSTGAEANLDLHLPKVIAPKQGFLSFYADAFDAGTDWTIEARVDDRGWLPLRPVVGWEPNYAAAFLAQDSASAPPATPRLPDPTLCYHLWRGFFPPDLVLGSHSLTVRATRPDGRRFVLSRPFRCELPQ